jgi:hypothetical protein
MRIYATHAELADWMDNENVPDKPKSMLRSASLLVEWATKNARYRVDSEGFPTEELIRTAFRDAVTAQIEFWVSLGVNPTSGTAGTALDVTGKSMDGASVSYGADKKVLAAKANAPETLGPVALGILSAAGLLSGPVRSF